MLAAFTPTVTLVLLYLFGVEIPTRRASAAVVLISAGCLLSSYGEVHFHPVGVAFRTLGIFSEATRLVLTQHLLKNHKLGVFESQ
jgi:drug/metabolite transporter (DMT)-like permease